MDGDVVGDLMTVTKSIKDPLGHGRIEVVHCPYFWKNERPIASSVHLVNRLVTFFVTPFITLFLFIFPLLPLLILLHSLPPFCHQENEQTVPFLGTRLSPHRAHDLMGRLHRSLHPHKLMKIVHLSLLYHLTSIHLQATEVF